MCNTLQLYCQIFILYSNSVYVDGTPPQQSILMKLQGVKRAGKFRDQFGQLNSATLKAIALLVWIGISQARI